MLIKFKKKYAKFSNNFFNECQILTMKRTGYEDVECQLSDPEVIADQKKYKQLSQNIMKSFVEMYREYRSLVHKVRCRRIIS